MQPAFTPSHRGGSGTPLLLLPGFTDTWRGWELVLPALEREHDVLALTLAGHAGGPPIEGEIDDAVLVGPVERALDEAGFETAHVAGNSLGGYVALQLAERGRARSVTALAPAGGWADHDESYRETLDHFRTMRELLRNAAPRRIDCPLRFVWGTDDRLLRWPTAAARFRDEWFPHADWVELDGVGHCPQLDVPAEAAELILGMSRG